MTDTERQAPLSFIPVGMSDHAGNEYFKAVRSPSASANTSFSTQTGALVNAAKAETHSMGSSSLAGEVAAKPVGSGQGFHEKWLTALTLGLVGLGGVAFHVYRGVAQDVTNLIALQKETGGKLDTLDARVNGRLDLMSQRVENLERTKRP